MIEIILQRRPIITHCLLLFTKLLNSVWFATYKTMFNLQNRFNYKIIKFVIDKNMILNYFF